MFTQYSTSGIGNMIKYRAATSDPFTNLYPVTGQVPVTYYTNPNQPNPVENVMDIAYGDVTDLNLVSQTIQASGGNTINPTSVRAPSSSESAIILGNFRLYSSGPIQSLIVRYRSSEHSGTAYAWWKKGITYTLGTQSGDSGTAIVANSDKAIIGLHRADSTTLGYGCPIV